VSTAIPRSEAPAALEALGTLDALDPATLVYDQNGLLPVVAQDVATGAVLMVAWADREAIEETRRTGLAHFHSRSRGRLWRKGETSGNELRVVGAVADCDRDTLLLRVQPSGPACHLGTRTCFEPNAARLELGWLADVVARRAEASPEESYTARLLSQGLPRVAQKVGEEAVETVIAALAGSDERSGEDPRVAGANNAALVTEAADLLFHLLVLLQAAGTDPTALARELERRHRDRTAAPERAPAGPPRTGELP
jgi:phosphoribosyl-ATP pyrophosphohydrolase/phosphoribosyl-AMP cyclohydrolase